MATQHTQSRIVGQRIATARQQAGLSINDLAERIGWPRDTLVNYELGRRAITIERLQVLAAGLGVSPAVLLIDDARLAAVVTRLAQEPPQLAHVQFFLDALQDDLPQEPDAEV